jgi:addiction module RelE/StbE family toxin
MAKYTLLYSPEAKENITHLPSEKLRHIAERVLLNLSENPFQGKKLLGKLTGLYSARITRRYRAIYQIDIAKHLIWIIDIAHRKEVYR